MHSAKLVKNWFLTKKINTFDWPANSPDLNIIENMWGLLSREVYSGGRQFSNVDELKADIVQKWDSIDQSVIHNLYDTLPHRIFNLINKNGKATGY